MKQLTGNELRKMFLDFFASKDHLIQPSSSLIPENDPTLLLIGAGMAPFKPFFTGKMKPPHPRISTSQKCVRTGDIENVGRTARHHTFFEMLGNFSFGDYFKKEAISWAWEFLTEYLELPKDKLWITIHTSDDEAFDIWHNLIKIPAERIIRMEENFWEIGPGPCGPCSEIHIDLGEERGCGKPDCMVGCDCDRYLEIWNLVFTQFDRDEAGNYTPLAKKNIDTGAGLERIASVLQNKRSNFETDLLYPIIEYTAKLARVTYGQSDKIDVSLKVIADHGRSMTVMIGDGVLPSNEGRGYVLRRILRRAVRHGRLLGIEKPFLTEIVDIAANILAEAYPDINDKKVYIKKVIQLEEERFHATLAQGIELLNKHVQELAQAGKKVFDGAMAFKLYDTFGFPWELTEEILNEHTMSLDKQGFDQAMAEQRERARAARQDSEERVVIPDLSGLVTESLHANPDAESAKVVLILKDGKVVPEAFDGEEIAVILDVTPFHAEGGGQVGDTGTITSGLGKFEVTNTRKLPDGTIYHMGHITEGSLKTGDPAKLFVDVTRRRHIARNHTATHLLQAALKQVLGEHVNQAGSSVDSSRLRFDFTHFAPVTTEQLTEVERIVNEVILSNTNLAIIETTQEVAKEMGAMALFGEKYGERVRVVIVGDFSKELCGGTHVSSTAEIGLFKIVSEAGIGAGLRRIEAVTGYGAHEYLKSQNELLKEAAAALKTRPEEIVARIDTLNDRVRELEKEIGALHTKLAKNEVQDLLAAAKTINGVQVVVGQVVAADMENLRATGDMIRDRLQSGVVVLGAVSGEKVNFIAMATADCVARGIHAGQVIKETAKVAGGGGGGRPDMAQAGGKQPEKVDEALKTAEQTIKSQIK
ncbi:alanine--tRNA ligase [Sporomusa acidovorans]|uniref:Alanine--tRNA ligase n=1 Tax=Sporomusa acidovorans (strain ATCC 49682 / DSM 3132 / Mol) TaxID=1123286 RepID=A0ABZ3J4N8_SPOA4|nr:alanine--tRNA ligase [Sporomusa acidovorans]OZC20862.1 alanine--tRNA ligase [Sporomusa acidovorans DSM 3132]SDE59504.1 alanyl-tRNA synthetase [Sporomusa acidovorans]